MLQGRLRTGAYQRRGGHARDAAFRDFQSWSKPAIQYEHSIPEWYHLFPLLLEGGLWWIV